MDDCAESVLIRLIRVKKGSPEHGRDVLRALLSGQELTVLSNPLGDVIATNRERTAVGLIPGCFDRHVRSRGKNK